MSHAKQVNSSVLRIMPSVDELLRAQKAEGFRAAVGLQRLTSLARSITSELRTELQQGLAAAQNEAEYTREALLDEALRRLGERCQNDQTAEFGRVINATGVILHTNLGRAPLSEPARTALAQAGGYCTLEHDIVTGERGRRGGRVEDLLVELTGAEAALVVNNCAAAALLILSVMAGGGETLVSRGELVEIGGDFRVPEVMATSGTRMVEIGTTNRTKLDDYRRAVNERTRLIMRVHPSNYRIVGFTATPTLRELSELAKELGLPLYEDAGSGVLSDLSAYGLADEPVIRESLRDGAAVVSFSGDKLLGACQAGLIVGRSDIVNRLRKHPLYRALRVDKLSLAVLEKTLEAYRHQRSVTEIPVLKMLSLTRAQLTQRAQSLLERYRQASLNDGSTAELVFEIRDAESAIGGGAGPNTHPDTSVIALSREPFTANEIAATLRCCYPPIICRVSDGKVMIDLRTVAEEEEAELLAGLLTLVK